MPRPHDSFRGTLLPRDATAYPVFFFFFHSEILKNFKDTVKKYFLL